MSHKGIWTVGFGGNGGKQFQFFNDNFRLIGVRGRSGDFIDNLIFDFQDISTGEIVSQSFGGDGGTQFQWLLTGKDLESITVWAQPNQYVHGLQFRLSSGEISPIFGKPTGLQNQIDVSSSFIAGAGGRSGIYIDQIKFYLISRECTQ